MSDELKPQMGPFPGQLGPHTARAIERMKTGKPGDEITLADMSDVVGRDCSTGGNGRGNVDTAIKRCEPDHAVVWRWQKDKQLWACLDDVGKSMDSQKKAVHIRRTARRSLRVAESVDRQKLTDDQRIQHDVNLAVTSMTYLVGQGHFRKKLAGQVGTVPLKEPEPQKLIELMKHQT